MICGRSGGNTPCPKFRRPYAMVNQTNAPSRVRTAGAAIAGTAWAS